MCEFLAAHEIRRNRRGKFMGRTLDWTVSEIVIVSRNPEQLCVTQSTGLSYLDQGRLATCPLAYFLCECHHCASRSARWPMDRKSELLFPAPNGTFRTADIFRDLFPCLKNSVGWHEHLTDSAVKKRNSHSAQFMSQVYG